MESYEINLAGETLTVQPTTDGNYNILREYQQIGTLYPNVSSNGIVWNCGDTLDPDYAKQIGELIEEHEL